jgi:hypothetical protein
LPKEARQLTAGAHLGGKLGGEMHGNRRRSRGREPHAEAHEGDGATSEKGEDCQHLLRAA